MREPWLESDRLDLILDQIVAVQLDLKLVCDGKKVDQNETTIAETCKILQSAAVELRNVILRLDDQRSETGTESVSHMGVS